MVALASAVGRRWGSLVCRLPLARGPGLAGAAAPRRAGLCAGLGTGLATGGLVARQGPRLLRAPGAGPAAAAAKRGYVVTRRAPIGEDQVIYGIIGINVGVFALWQTANPFFMYKHFTCSPDGLAVHHRFHTLLTCTFSHQNVWHLVFNMAGLYFFGGQLAHVLGARSFAMMYLVSGVVSSAAQAFSAYRDRRRTVLYGASGSVNSCVAFSVLEWPSRLIMVYGIVPVPAILFGIVVMFQDVAGALDGGASGFRSSQVGYVAHLVGAGVGVVQWALWRRGRRMF